MMQPNALLHETLPREYRIARLESDRSASADAIKQLLSIVDDPHPELGQQSPIEGTGGVELANRQNHVSHPVDLNRHQARPSPSDS
jgi:hypothetical protein